MAYTVSWIIPVKNGMPFLTETLASLAAQTYLDFQVLVWDDGSTDGTNEELKRWIPTRLPGRVITGKPRSVGGALRELVEIADTEFCARIDSDDICHPDRLERQINFLQAHPEIALVGSNLRIIDEKGRPTGATIDYPSNYEGIVSEFITRNPIGHPSVVFRRASVLKVGNYDSAITFEDYDLWMRLAQHSKLANLPDYLVDYRFHPQSLSRQQEKAKINESFLRQVFVKHATSLFGLTPSEAEGVSGKRDSILIIRAWKMARHLSKTQGGSTWGKMRSASFIHNLRLLIRSRDLISRFALAVLDRNSNSVWRELAHLLVQILNRLPLGPRLVESLRARRARHKFESWRRQQNSSDRSIHQEVEFTGRANGQTYVQIDVGSTLERDITIWISPDTGSQPELALGEKVFIGRNTYLGVYKPIRIGNRVLIGAYCYLISSSHCIERRDIPINDQGSVGAPINIEDDAWLGTHVVVLPGVTIGRGAVVGAGSVVTCDIPAWEIWGGVPARFIKYRPG